MYALHRPIHEAIKLLPGYLAHPCALLPLLKAHKANSFTVHCGLTFKLLGAMNQEWQIKLYLG